MSLVVLFDSEGYAVRKNANSKSHRSILLKGHYPTDTMKGLKKINMVIIIENRRLIRMVKAELVEIHETLRRRYELYEKRTKKIDLLFNIGLLLTMLDIVMVIPAIAIVSGIFLQLPPSLVFFLFVILVGIGPALALITKQYREEKRLPSGLSPNEEEFVELFKALENLDIYFQKREMPFKVEAANCVSRLQKRINVKTLSRMVTDSFLYSLLWRIEDEFKLLKENLDRRLLPSIDQDNDEMLRKAYRIIEELAEYFIDPSEWKLHQLNASFSNLPLVVEEKPLVVPLLKRHPIIQHFASFILFGGIAWFSFYLGVTFSIVTRDVAWATAWGLWAALSAGYFVILSRRG